MEIETETHIETLDLTNSLGSNEKQREGDYEQGKQNQRGLSSDNGWG